MFATGEASRQWRTRYRKVGRAQQLNPVERLEQRVLFAAPAAVSQAARNKTATDCGTIMHSGRIEVLLFPSFVQ
jgi:hypothetical protein